MEATIQDCMAAERYDKAFERILDMFRHKVFRLACGMLKNETLAEDAAQEIFMKVWKALPRYRGQASLSTWIYAISRNHCLDVLRKELPRKTMPLAEPAVAREAESARSAPPQEAGSSMLTRDLGILMERLPEAYRQVLVLYYWEEKSYDEVSDMLDLPLGTVKTYLHRAKKDLATFLRRDSLKAIRQKEYTHGMPSL